MASIKFTTATLPSVVQLGASEFEVIADFVTLNSVQMTTLDNRRLDEIRFDSEDSLLDYIVSNYDADDIFESPFSEPDSYEFQFDTVGEMLDYVNEHYYFKAVEE